MPSSYYPTLEHPIENYTPQVTGQSIARSIEQLDEICLRIAQKPLSSFYSESNREAYEMLDQEPPEDLEEGDPVQWSDPADGLRTVSALSDYIRSHPQELPDPESLQQDLRSFRTVFSNALAHATRFRLRIG